MVKFSTQAKKYIEKQDKPTKQRIKAAISSIPAGDIKKLQGAAGYRLRVGDIRILFDYDGDNINVNAILPRGDVYKRV